jgi:DHA1 family inner membrane transport protein
MIRWSSKYRLPPTVILATGTFALGINGFVLGGLLPGVARDLHVGLEQAGQLTTAFAIAYAVGSPVIATATGRLDRRWVLGGGLLVFLIGMIGQAAGPDYPVVLVGRIVSGLGAAAFQATAYAVAGVLAPPERRARSLAAVGVGSSLANVVGVPLGVLVGQVIGWRATLWSIAAAAVVAAVMCLLLPPVALPLTSLRERLRVLATPALLLLLVTTAVQLVPQYVVISYVGPVLGAESNGSSLVLIALVAFGVALLIGNRLVGSFVEWRGPVFVIAVGLSVTGAAAIGLGLFRTNPVGATISLAVIGLVGVFQITPQQTRVIGASGSASTAALGLNGSMIYVGSGGGAAIGAGAIALGGVSAIPIAAAAMAAVALIVILATRRIGGRPAPESRRPSPSRSEERTI